MNGLGDIAPPPAKSFAPQGNQLQVLEHKMKKYISLLLRISPKLQQILLQSMFSFNRKMFDKYSYLSPKNESGQVSLKFRPTPLSTPLPSKKNHYFIFTSFFNLVDKYWQIVATVNRLSSCSNIQVSQVFDVEALVDVISYESSCKKNQKEIFVILIQIDEILE